MPLYWRLFEGTSAFVVFLHRCLWAFPFLILFALVLKRNELKEILAFDVKRFPWLATSGLLIGANWWIYIYGVEAHQVVEMSLGYFLAPLLSAAMGVVFLRERLSLGQWIGVLAVVLGVGFYGFNVGRIPVMAIGLALTFSFYSLIRKVVQVHPVSALTTETFVLFVLAAFYAATGPENLVFGQGWDDHRTLLILGGTLTALPLLWFAVGVRGLTMTTMGMLNYISPTGKFIIAVFLFGEVVTNADLWAFCLIWSGIIWYLASTYRRQKSLPVPE